MKTEEIRVVSEYLMAVTASQVSTNRRMGYSVLRRFYKFLWALTMLSLMLLRFLRGSAGTENTRTAHPECWALSD